MPEAATFGLGVCASRQACFWCQLLKALVDLTLTVLHAGHGDGFG
jgi:hypothetical protein